MRIIIPMSEFYKCSLCNNFMYENGFRVDKNDKLALDYMKKEWGNAAIGVSNSKIEYDIKHICNECFAELGRR